jgi:hypothetical protein
MSVNLATDQPAPAPAPAERPETLARPARRLAAPGLAALAAALWLLGLHTVLPAQMGSLGLIVRLSPLQLAA